MPDCVRKLLDWAAVQHAASFFDRFSLSSRIVLSSFPPSKTKTRWQMPSGLEFIDFGYKNKPPKTTCTNRRVIEISMASMAYDVCFRANSVFSKTRYYFVPFYWVHAVTKGRLGYPFLVPLTLTVTTPRKPGPASINYFARLHQGSGALNVLYHR